MSKKTIGIIGIFLVGIALGFTINAFTPVKLTGLFIGSSDASSKIKSLYELANPGVSVEVVKLDDVSGIYKVLLKSTDVGGGVNYKEVYMTKDGELLTESIISVDQFISQLSRTHNFIDCLADKGIKIAGIANTSTTVLQFNVLGGAYASKLYLSCDGDNIQQCVQAGITQVPTAIYQNKGYAGVQSIQFFENLTSCKF